MTPKIGIVLAGGAGRRFGGPKGAFPWQGQTLAERAARTLHPLCSLVLVSVGPGQANPAPAFRCLVDPPPPGRGPLAALDAAFDATGSADLLVLACDYPAMGSAFLQALLGAADPEADLVFPVDPRGRDHPLVGLWRRSARPAVRESVAAGHLKVRGVLADLNVHRVVPSDLPGWNVQSHLVNVNRREDLERLGG